MEEKTDTISVTDLVRAQIDSMKLWQETLNLADIFLYAVLLVAVFLFRKPLSRLAIALKAKFFRSLGIELPENSIDTLESATSAILVSFALLFFLSALNLPGPMATVTQRLAITAIIVALFAGAYNMTGPLNERAARAAGLRLEANWIERVVRFSIVVVGLAAIFRVWGLDLSGALTGVGVLGAGFMIAAQDLIRNLVAGMTNLSEERFETGDVIEVSGQFLGTVRDINLRSTTIEGFDNIPRFVPNADLSNATVLNWTRRRHRRILMDVGLLLSTSEEQIEEVCDRIQAHLDTSKDFVVRDDVTRTVTVHALSEDAVELQIYAFTVSPDYLDYLAVRQRLNLAILRILRVSGTELAYPTRTVHVEHAAKPGIEPDS